MPAYSLKFIGMDELKEAVRRNPDVVLEEVGKFLARGIAVYKSGIIRNPWTIGATGGGAPVKTAHLRDTHQMQVGRMEAKIFPTAPYSIFVHEGTKKMQARPWLDFVKDSKDKEIQGLEQDLLNSIVTNLAK